MENLAALVPITIDPNDFNNWDSNPDQEIYESLAQTFVNGFKDGAPNPESPHGSYHSGPALLFDNFQTGTNLNLAEFTAQYNQGPPGSQTPAEPDRYGQEGGLENTDKGNTHAQKQDQGENGFPGSTTGGEQQQGENYLSFSGGWQTQTLVDQSQFNNFRTLGDQYTDNQFQDQDLGWNSIIGGLQENSFLNGQGGRNLLLQSVGPASVHPPENGLTSSLVGSGVTQEVAPEAGPACTSIAKKRNAKKRNASGGTSAQCKKARAGGVDTKGEAERAPAQNAEDEVQKQKEAERRRKEAKRAKMNRDKAKSDKLADEKRLAQLTEEVLSLEGRVERSKLTCVICTTLGNCYCEVHEPSTIFENRPAYLTQIIKDKKSIANQM